MERAIIQKRNILAPYDSEPGIPLDQVSALESGTTIFHFSLCKVLALDKIKC